MYWPGIKPSFLDQDHESRLVAHLGTLPYQEGTPLSPIHEGDDSTEIATESSGEYSPERELFTITSPANGGTSNQNRTPQCIEQRTEVSQDELSVEGETENQRTLQRARNIERAERRRLLEARVPIVNLEAAFEVVQGLSQQPPQSAN